MFSFLIRSGQRNDIPLLEDVERSAAAAFLVLPDYALSHRTVSVELLNKMVLEKKLWVAVNKEDRLIGFIGCRDMDNICYIHEISVAHEFQKQGVGRKLMLTVLDEMASRGYNTVGLTTRRDAKWNMPFYKTLGFYEMVDKEACPALHAQLHNEISEGASPLVRCAMIKNLELSSRLGTTAH